MNIITLDFETYFDDEYTLKKLTTEAYIRDPRFEAHGVGIRYADGAEGLESHLHLTEWCVGDDIRARFASIDWTNTAVLCHHAQFDGLILSHHFGIKPALWLDTLSMARLVVGNHLSVSLDSLAKHFDLVAKNVPYNLFRGKHWHQLTPDEQRLVAEGCLHDCELTWQIYNLLAAEFPREEYPIVDMTVRMFTEPTLVGDIELLGKVWMDEARRKQTLLEELGVNEEELQSSNRFAELLRAEGVEPEMKDGKNGPIYAFAKTDDFMKELIEDDSQNPVASALARSRLGVRSTIDQTRAERLGYMAGRGAMPVYLRYSGAHTTRWSGGDSVNWQNFRRGSDLRKAIMAPPGTTLAVIDESQIECRILNMLAGEETILDKFRTGEDPYIGIASEAYGREITKADKAERGTGKQLELSCGFGAGALTIQKTAKLGIYGPPVIIDEATALSWRDIYRRSHPNVVRYWGDAGRMLSRLAGGEPTDWGPLRVDGGRIYLPNGAWLNYRTLEYDSEWQSWKIKTRSGWTRMYGPKLVENVVQALARVVLSQAMLRIRSETDLPIVNCTHDEVVVLVKDDANAQPTLDWLMAEMRRPPVWLPELPLDCEGSLSERYDK